jgi:hypothetical protein
MRNSAWKILWLFSPKVLFIIIKTHRILIYKKNTKNNLIRQSIIPKKIKLKNNSIFQNIQFRETIKVNHSFRL